MINPMIASEMDGNNPMESDDEFDLVIVEDDADQGVEPEEEIFEFSAYPLENGNGETIIELSESGAHLNGEPLPFGIPLLPEFLRPEYINSETSDGLHGNTVQSEVISYTSPEEFQ